MKFIVFVLMAIGLMGLYAPVRAAPESAPAAAYFPILPYGADNTVAPELLPVAANHPLDADHAGMTRAIIVIHDTPRDANAALTALMALAGANNATTFILAPQFLLDSDIAHFAGQLPEQGRMFARWPLDGWIMGGDSLPLPPQQGISSFTALDLILLYLGEKKFFPDLQQVVIAGSGAGGDFIQRYAALGQAPDILDKQNLPVRFIVANASSYLYFTAPRPKNGGQGFASVDAAQCPNYNAYPYGLDRLNDYARRMGPNAAKLHYAARHVVYLVGDGAQRNDPLPDAGCAAGLEGADRLTRAMNYDLYLNVIYGDAAAKTQTFAPVPQAAYDPAALFGSSCGMAALFGDGACG